MNEITPQNSRFLPAEKCSPEEIQKQSELLFDNPLTRLMLDSIPDIFMILNKFRQVVYINEMAKNILGPEAFADAYGKRPGEIFACQHSLNETGGCGTTEFCKYCGAAQSINESLHNKSGVKECRITTIDGNALDFRIFCRPVQILEDQYSIFILKDIADEKRRQALERIFSHDILNTAGGINGLAGMMKGTLEENRQELLEMIHSASETLVEEIHAQKDLAMAENGGLKIHLSETGTLSVLKDVLNIYKNHETALERKLVIDENSQDIQIQTDPRLLKRVLGNMTKNALEATPFGETVTLSVYGNEEKAVFSVHNPSYMPDEVQKQVFNRSFSTKGSGRGIGTWSVKLLTEKYLKGVVRFETSQQQGTTFFSEIPVRPKSN
jgi:nitrogen-specific signal transduction histidine kinase